MFEKKYRIPINDEEKIMIQSLIDLKNSLIEQGKYTDAVDELLVKVIESKQK